MTLEIVVEFGEGRLTIPLDDRTARRVALQWVDEGEEVEFEFGTGDGAGHLTPKDRWAIPLSELGLAGAKALRIETLDIGGNLGNPAQAVAEILGAKEELLERGRLDLGAVGSETRLVLGEASALLRLRLRLEGKGRFRGLRLRIGEAGAAAATGSTSTPDGAARGVDWLALAPEAIRRPVASLGIVGHLDAMWESARAMTTDAQTLGRLAASLSADEAPAAEPGARFASELGAALPDIARALEALQRRLRPLVNQASVLRAPTPATGSASEPLAADAPRPDTARAVADHAAALHRAQGPAAAVAWSLFASPPGQRAHALGHLGDAVRDAGRADAETLAWLAFLQNPSPSRANTAAGRLFGAGDLTRLRPFLALGRNETPSPFIGEVRLSSKLWSEGIDIPPRRAGAPPASGVDVAYIANMTLPFYVSGYTTRTHQLLKSLTAAGVTCRCFTRPNFPWDRPEMLPPDGVDEQPYGLDGVTYAHTRAPAMTPDPERHIERMSEALENRCREVGARIIHAASNQRNALPALIAARRLGVPFVYELRGLWELTAAARTPGWEFTDRFALERRLEILIASEADHVCSITQGVADLLIAEGVPAERISLLPNAVDPEAFAPLARDAPLAATLGVSPDDFVMVYCGTLTIYEGLDDLIAAVGLLRRRGVRARLIVAGAGPMQESLQCQTGELGLTEAVHFVGRIEPGDVRRYLSLADVVALPRKPFPICEIVSPLKPFEAMAMGKPVVLSDLAALREIVAHEETGLLCRPADPQDLAATLQRLAEDPALRRRLGDTGREWVLSRRTWEAAAAKLLVLYDDLSERLFAPAINASEILKAVDER
jgi:glycosyltransferase involved in cell wall biosynthesis